MTNDYGGQGPINVFVIIPDPNDKLEQAIIRLAERFWSKVDVRGPDDCWPWLAHRDRDGYGRFGLGEDRVMPATHVALAMVGRPVRKGKMALHTCDNPTCCNPLHLRPGTQAQNVRDSIERGSHVSLRFKSKLLTVDDGSAPCE